MSDVAGQVRTGPSSIPAYLALGAGLSVLAGLFWREGQAAVGVWIDSTAYGHCFLVLPIALYLIWDRRAALRGLAPRPTPWLALAGLPLPFLWLTAERLGIMEGRQLAVLGLVEVLLLATLGWTLFRAVMGPLLYLLFLVPSGAFITPWLQSFTAHFVEVGLTVLDIPHIVTDMLIEVPAGQFYVAEACAGLRFLIAAVAFGVFFAILNYTSPWRRVAFIAASVAVPIVANGFRALGIVVLGQMLGSAQAAAADHIIYGWVFFSIIMVLLVLGGLPFRQPPLPARQGPMQPAPPPALSVGAVLPVLLLAAIGPAAALAIGRSAPPARLLDRPRLAAPGGCTLAPGPQTADRASFTLACTPRRWSITLQAVPGQATAAAVNDARARMAPVPEGDEATTGPLADSPGWRVITSGNPGQVTGFATWVNGQPAQGGLHQRLQQARASILGGTGDSLVMTATLRADHPMAPPEMQAATAELARFVASQPDLTAEVARITGAR